MKKARKHPQQQTTPRKRKAGVSVQWARSPSKAEGLFASLVTSPLLENASSDASNAASCRDITESALELGEAIEEVSFCMTEVTEQVIEKSVPAVKEHVVISEMTEAERGPTSTDLLLKALNQLENDIHEALKKDGSSQEHGVKNATSGNSMDIESENRPPISSGAEYPTDKSRHHMRDAKQPFSQSSLSKYETGKKLTNHNHDEENKSSQKSSDRLIQERQGITRAPLVSPILGSAHSLAGSRPSSQSEPTTTLVRNDTSHFLSAAFSAALAMDEPRTNCAVGQLPAYSASCSAGYSNPCFYRLKVTIPGAMECDMVSGEYIKRVQVYSRLYGCHGIVEMRGRWVESELCAGDNLNFVNTKHDSSSRETLSESFCLIVTDDANFIIIRPDVLVCPTRVADAHSCLRRVALTERLASDMPSRETILGHMKHTLFQYALRANRFDEDFLRSMIKHVVISARAVEDLFRVGMSEDDAAYEIEKVIKGYAEWGALMMGAHAMGQKVEFAMNEIRLVKIIKVLATEELIWSPMWGMKGALDVTAIVRVSDPKNEMNYEDLVLPLELKTGKVNVDRPEHRAQIMLYSLLIADRYHSATVPRTEAGILVRPLAGSMSADVGHSGLITRGVRNVHFELRDLLMIRNRIAVNTSSSSASHPNSLMLPKDTVDEDEREKLPKVTGNVGSECVRCFQRDICSLVHLSVENGTQESLGLSIEDLTKSLGPVLAPAHLAYYGRWYRILELEGKHNITSQKQIWTRAASFREKKRVCISGLRMRVVSMSDSTQLSQVGGTVAVLEFTRKPLPGPSETNVQVGDLVLVGAEHAHVAVCKGHVIALSQESILVRTSAFPALSLAPELSNSQAWCIDKLEILWGNRFLQGSLASLFVQARSRSAASRDEKEDVETQHGLRQKERMRSLIVDLRTPQFWDPDQPGKRSIRDCDLNFLQHLLTICDTPELIRRALFAKKIPVSVASRPERLKQLDLRTLTRDQASAVTATLSAKDYLCIIGAPGAGKTSTIAFIVHMLHLLGKSVLVSSFTHAACDNLLLKIRARGCEVLRIGLATNVHKDLRSSTLSDVSSVADLERHLANPRLVCGATCLGVKHALIQRKLFDYCILDEAGQLAEPFALGPFTRAKCTLFVGDPKQLPPLVVSNEARAMGMEQSLFERLVERHPHAVVKLTTQFRMNESIVALANELFYQGQLSCGNEQVALAKANLPLLSKAFKPGEEQSWLCHAVNPSNPVVFLNTDGLRGGARESRRILTAREETEMASQYTLDEDEEESFVINETEVSIVQLIVDKLMRSGMPLRNIGVISPYRSQLRLLRQRVIDAVEVDTVDKYQGRDKECIIVSLVRSNAPRNVGALLSDWRRLNVAFTRAKTKLVIIGSADTLLSPKFCQEFLPFVRQRGWTVDLAGDDVSQFSPKFSGTGTQRS